MCVLLFHVCNGCSLVKNKYVKDCKKFTIEKNWCSQKLLGK